MDWRQLPDIIGMVLLAVAFASVLRRNGRPGPELWLIGWLFIILHFFGLLFAPLPGIWGAFAQLLSCVSLVWAGLFFMRESVSYLKHPSIRPMSICLLVGYTIYILVLRSPIQTHWPLILAALLLALGPLTVAGLAWRQFHPPIRIYMTLTQIALVLFLLTVQNRTGNGRELALDAIFFIIFFNCSVHYLNHHRRATTGTFVLLCGYMTWASIFIIGPTLQEYFPAIHVEREIWNLPKYVVAVGMILVLLEGQIRQNRYLALHDELTGLPNRRLFQDRLQGSLDRAQRTDTKTALLFIDLNDFKQVNDTLGHHAGDLLLTQVTRLFETRLRRTDTVARIGGDEFSLILESPITLADAEAVAHSLLTLLTQPIPLEKHLIRIGLSIGIAMYPEDGKNAEELSIAADKRMYQAKQNGESFLLIQDRLSPEFPMNTEIQIIQ